MKRLASLIFVLALGACGGGSGNPEPTPDAAQRPDSGVADAGPDAAVVDAGADASPEPDANCEGDGGCYACDPHTTPEFLNHCTSGQCVPFDNEARLPLYNHGTLPPAP